MADNENDDPRCMTCGAPESGHEIAENLHPFKFVELSAGTTPQAERPTCKHGNRECVICFAEYGRAVAPVETPKMTDDQIKHMVNRFLAWRLPDNFNPDGGVSFKPIRNEKSPWPAKNEPVGTNLLDYTQAEQMIRYLVDGMPCAAPVETPEEKTDARNGHSDTDNYGPVRVLSSDEHNSREVLSAETRLTLAAAVMKHFHHCRCDQQIKKTSPCLYCQAKEEADAR